MAKKMRPMKSKRTKISPAIQTNHTRSCNEDIDNRLELVIWWMRYVWSEGMRKEMWHRIIYSMPSLSPFDPSFMEKVKRSHFDSRSHLFFSKRECSLMYPCISLPSTYRSVDNHNSPDCSELSKNQNGRRGWDLINSSISLITASLFWIILMGEHSDL